MLRLAVNAVAPDREVLDRAAAVIRAGGVVAIPTDTLYGLAADPTNGDAVARVFAVKGRDATQALPLIAADASQVEGAFGALPDLARRLANRFWPGPLTLLLPAVPWLAAPVSAGTGTVGVRVPADAVARGLCRHAGGLLTATSANRSGEPASADPDVVAGLEGVDLLLDAGRTAGGAPSTIVDVSGADVRLIRAGAISWDEVRMCADHG